jgi:hypothetical protein
VTSDLRTSSRVTIAATDLATYTVAWLGRMSLRRSQAGASILRRVAFCTLKKIEQSPFAKPHYFKGFRSTSSSTFGAESTP